MGWLPHVALGRHVVPLPWSETTCAVLADCWVSHAGGDASDDAIAQLNAAFAVDPAAVLWGIVHSSVIDHVETRTLGTLVRWFLERGSSAVTDHRGGRTTVPPDDLPIEKLESLADLAARNVRIARVAEQLSRSSSSEAAGHADECYLAGLLCGFEEWFSEFGPPSVGRILIRVLPNGLGDLIVSQPGPRRRSRSKARRRRDLDSPADFVHEAAAIVAGKREPPARIRRTAASGEREHRRLRNGWLANVPGVGRRLPQLARRMIRLAELEHDFQTYLEAEKLEAMAEFAAGAGHEVNNPLAVISGRAQLFLRHEEDPERRRELALIHGQAMRAYEMIADMMLFARPPRPRPESCDVVALVDQVVRDFAERADLQGTALRRIDASGSYTLRADGVQLAVALRAVVDNALEALGEGGNIEIALERAPSESGVRTGSGQRQGTVDESVAIVVRDNGPGIADKVRRHLFDPYYSGREAGRGLGLGLSKCWRIITNHGGTVLVDSAPGRGATFTLLLPVAGPTIEGEGTEEAGHEDNGTEPSR